MGSARARPFVLALSGLTIGAASAQTVVYLSQFNAKGNNNLDEREQIQAALDSGKGAPILVRARAGATYTFKPPLKIPSIRSRWIS